MTASPVLGVLGGGQLGRMLAVAASRLGVRTRVLDGSPDAPAGDVAELHVGRFDDERALARFAEGLSVATYEFENIPSGPVRALAEMVDVRPGVRALEIAQDRVDERELARSVRVPTPRDAAVDGAEGLDGAIGEVGLPAILKTRRMGYDGKGQVVISGAEDVARAGELLKHGGCLLDRKVGFARELSIIGARSMSGEIAFYPLCENVHEGGILRVTRAPAEAPAIVRVAAERHLRAVAEALGYVGVLTLELFDMGEGAEPRLLLNEIAPRVHNSGHWTIEGAHCDQFESHVRAVMGMALGDTGSRGHSAMVNLIGSLPDAGALLRVRGGRVHLYGKEARPGRKLGHVTLTDEDPKRLDARVDELLRLVRPSWC
ncbi:MAG: 5-(carboxyamino)imidazole ribonucleotide synthase [Phycisphaerales bacterium]|jgi:5-(carboxyamino)imidazole ribonucleotide synthase|nr:5-(carboxyamino)imidazole ribonucleotide synthase [Phycisphaerales bacterium]